MPTVHLVVSGKVQGVYYRSSAKEAAEVLQIKGTVRNNRLGQVEIIASGSSEQIEHFINWCYIGPPAARVREVGITELEEMGFTEFSILR
ncbi:MAG: acylphosphatase [Chitinophagales bacterium]